MLGFLTMRSTTIQVDDKAKKRVYFHFHAHQFKGF
jgi:hypothetical protein